MSTKTASKNQKKRRFKRRYWLLIDLAVVVIILSLLLYKPSRYNPSEADVFGLRDGQVHTYWTYLSSEIYNGAQRREPFDIVIIDKKINEAIAGWSEVSEEIILHKPVVLFVPEIVVLMVAADIKGVALIVTIELKPQINEKELLSLQIAKVKMGAMNITPLAKVVAKKMYAQRLETVPVDMEDWRAKIVGSLLNDEPFEPVFPAEDKKVRVEKITIDKGKLTLSLVPAP